MGTFAESDEVNNRGGIEMNGVLLVIVAILLALLALPLIGLIFKVVWFGIKLLIFGIFAYGIYRFLRNRV